MARNTPASSTTAQNQQQKQPSFATALFAPSSHPALASENLVQTVNDKLFKKVPFQVPATQPSKLYTDPQAYRSWIGQYADQYSELSQRDTLVGTGTPVVDNRISTAVGATPLPAHLNQMARGNDDKK